MPTAPTLVFSSVVPGSATTHTSAAFAFQTGDVVVITAVNEGASLNDSYSLPTTTLAGQTITQLQLHLANNDPAAGAWKFTASANSGTTDTVTVALSPAVARNFVLTVLVYRNSAGTGSSALGTGSARTLAYTATQADSAIHWIVGDWAAAAVQTETPPSTVHNTSTPGPS